MPRCRTFYGSTINFKKNKNMKRFNKILAACALSVNLSTSVFAQQGVGFEYPQMPDTLRTVEKRAEYLGLHYWDRFDFSDTLKLNNPDIVEQGFVNYIDILPRFQPEVAQSSMEIFASKAFSNAKAKAKFEKLIEHYLDDPESPMRNDRTYLLFLREMSKLSAFDETEKERLAFKIKQLDKNLPGDIATDFTWKDEKGSSHKLSEYRDQKVILYFYDPECENCHRVTEWLNKQTIPQDITFLKIIADDTISDLYSIRAMPTIFLLDKENRVVLKDCTPELLIDLISH